MGSSVQPAARDPERLRFESRVVDREGSMIELEETYFFAESGGQPPDRGTIAGATVVDVHRDEDRTVHVLDGEPSIARGDTVEGQIDESFRTYCRRAHTASHVVYGAGRQELDDLGYGGFEIGADKVRVDLSADVAIDEAMLIRLERLANQGVWDSRAVEWYELSSEEAREDDQIAFNVATEEGVFSAASDVRIVEIDDWDIAACGGTHVRNTAEIGPIVMLDRSNPGQGLTRIEFAVGPSAIEHLASVHSDARAAARELDVSPGSIAEGVAELDVQATDRQARIDELQRQLLEQRLDELHGEALDVNGNHWVIGEVPDFDGGVATTAIRERIEAEEVDVIVAVSGAERSTIAVSATDGVHAGEVIDGVTAALGGGGGGGSGMAQGGGIPARPGEVIAHLERELQAE